MQFVEQQGLMQTLSEGRQTLPYFYCKHSLDEGAVYVSYYEIAR